MRMTGTRALFFILCCLGITQQKGAKVVFSGAIKKLDAVDTTTSQASYALDDSYASFSAATNRDLHHTPSIIRADLSVQAHGLTGAFSLKNHLRIKNTRHLRTSRRLARSEIKYAEGVASTPAGASGGINIGPAGSEGARALAQAAAKKSNRNLNVLMVVLDDLRPDLAAWGHSYAPSTPHIDAFARRARVFRRAYAQFPDCAPSRQSFLTGMRPDRLSIASHDCTNKIHEGVECDFRKSRPGTVSMPEFFRKAGYLTLSYGKVFHQGLDDALS